MQIIDLFRGKKSGGVKRSKESQNKQSSRFFQSDWKNFPSQPPICSGDDGISIRLDGITFPEWRRESIRALGNAIVPQVAYLIFKSIDEYENMRI